MKEKIRFIGYKCKWTLRKIVERFTGKVIDYSKVGKKRILDAQEANQKIYEAIQSGEPFACVRYGMAELLCAMEVDQDRLFGTDKMNGLVTFETKEEVYRWLEMLENDSKKIDYCAVWYRAMMEDWVYEKYATDASFMHYSALEPYYFDNPWSAALKGKKVLVINPFNELIEQQYKQREFLFDNKEILPEFELSTLKSVWFIKKGENPDFEDWFEAMEHMRKQVRDLEFDVAIIGCGPFGFHLAADVKRMEKQAIVLGGATQILFGIKGKRWDEIPQVSKFYNQFWVRPDGESAPKGAQALDKGCYW